VAGAADGEVKMNDTIDAWTELEKRVCAARNMSFMLVATLNSNEAKDKTAAMAFGILELDTLIVEVKEAYNKLHGDVREAHLASANTNTDKREEVTLIRPAAKPVSPSIEARR
jgi:hypothetical protein